MSKKLENKIENTDKSETEFDFDNFEFKTLEDFEIWNRHAR